MKKRVQHCFSEVLYYTLVRMNSLVRNIFFSMIANMTVEDFFESPNRNTIGKVLMMLDLMDKEKWWNLGIKIELDAKSLKRINVDCKNRQEDPGSHVINIISTSQPKMTIGQFKKKLENIGRKDIAGKLKKLPGL